TSRRARDRVRQPVRGARHRCASYGEQGRWEALAFGGREPGRSDAVTWAREGACLGAGEILLTSWDRDGTRLGPDLELLRAVAVVDLDAALGKGSNAAVIHEMVRRAPCRVGGGIRDLDTARAWLDAGAARVMIGTAASPEFCGALPRERLIAAVDAEHGQVV